ncbi:hypothetical protein MCUN1_003811 [Malassezia cuniculi]|uniref:Mitochondrial carrier n=1 Tax=Malassezia cuniculi TaxID=948313 RepID=A0AAF0EYQ3_9BASI|nr:hypothetical protein MCUN1_003811 [Malassezia cuniculi]
MSAASTTKTPQPLPAYVQFGAGAIAGVVELSTLYPLDVVKTRLQLARQGSGAPYRSSVGALVHIARSEGLGRLYRGLSPLLILDAPKRAAIGACGGNTNSPWVTTLTGGLAGATEALVVVPFEFVKIRLQDKSRAQLYRGPIDVLRHAINEGGARTLYRALPSTMNRHFAWNAGYFGTIPQVRKALPKADSRPAQLFNNFVSGAVSGTVGTILNTPFDVVVTRIQSETRTAGTAPRYNGTYQSLFLILREEGPLALYRGFVPKVMRLAPGGGILLLVVDVVLTETRKWLGPPYIVVTA